MARPRPGTGKAVVLGENGLVWPVVVVPGQRPGVRATACGPLSAGGGGLRVLGAGGRDLGRRWGARSRSPERLRGSGTCRPAVP